MMNRFALSALTLSLLTAPLAAQETTTQPAPGGVQTAEARSGEQMQNNVLGTCVILGNQKEIAALQYGMTKTQNAKIKQFCEHAMKDHKEYIQKLKEKGKVQPLVTLREMSMTMENNNQNTGEIRLTGATDNPREAGQANQGNQNNNDAWATRILKIDQEVCQQCLTSARKELEKRQGADFDKAFVGMQLAAHMQMKDQLTVYQRHATGELRTLFAQGIESTEQHYSQLRDIMKTLESSGAKSVEN